MEGGAKSKLFAKITLTFLVELLKLVIVLFLLTISALETPKFSLKFLTNPVLELLAFS